MPTPREERAAARDISRLQVPPHGLGRADIIRSRSPSPVALGAFNFPRPEPQPVEEQFNDAPNGINGNNMAATPEQLEAIRDELRREMRNEMRNEAAAAAAGIPDAIKRKPEIPSFDKAHVDHWIRRTENAFIRANVNSPREKFAFLETKFPVDFNPRINDFLWGDPTADRWTEFIAYLRTEYGTTKQQRASVFLDGLKRDGKRPSQYVAHLNDKTKDVTITDIKKEMLLRELPTDIQRMLQERFETLTLEEAAAAADAYFDQDGKLRQKAPAINAVTNQTRELTPPPVEDSDEINAVGRRFNNSRSGNFQRGKQPFKKPQFSNAPTPQPKTPQKQSDPNLCFYHNEFGIKAKKCEVGCSRFDEKRFAGNGKAGK